MNRTTHALIGLMFLVMTTPAIAANDAPSVEQGMKMFNSTSLGTNGRSCATCHPDGKGLEDAADYDKTKLDAMANKCIVNALKGNALAENSPDLDSLVMYMNTLGKAKAK